MPKVCQAKLKIEQSSMVDNETPSFMDTMIINKVGPSRESAEKYEQEGIEYASNDHIES